jgi:hypothetical protein
MDEISISSAKANLDLNKGKIEILSDSDASNRSSNGGLDHENPRKFVIETEMM